MHDGNVTQDCAPASPPTAPSTCCLQPRLVWRHWREGKAGEYATMHTVVICAACRGPADGKRPEEVDASLPWRLVRKDAA